MIEEVIEKVDTLKEELDSLRPISKKRLDKIMQKFRLDWNYHSNSIEGNKLTYGETKLLLLHGLTAKGKPLKDHLDIQGHNDALLFLESILSNPDQRPITQNFIRELHSLILKESYSVPVEDSAGNRMYKEIKIGEYKTFPNHVKTITGEIFYFAEPHEVPAKMADLLSWYQEKSDHAEFHPILLAAEFHYNFVRIHPFDDGNGRLARILMNLILMEKGYAPVIIKVEEKERYYEALRQADGGDIESFASYIGSELERTMEIMIRGAKGEDIEESTDLQKRILLLQRKLDSKKTEKVQTKRNNENTFEVLQRSVFPLLREMIEKLSHFHPFFHESEAFISSDDGNTIWPKINLFENKSTDFLEKYIYNNYLSKENASFSKMEISFYWRAFVYGGTKTPSTGTSIALTFSEYKYQVVWQKNMGARKQISIEKLYHQAISDDELHELSQSVFDEIYETVDSWTD